METGLTQAFSPEILLGTQAGSNSGKSEIATSAGTSPSYPPRQNPTCPKCGSSRTWRDGHGSTIFGDEIQRWLCRKCSFRFSDPQQTNLLKAIFEKKASENGTSKSIKSDDNILLARRIRVQETKNLVPEQTTRLQKVPEREEEIKGTLIQFAWKMRQEGYQPETIRGNAGCLKGLTVRGANLNDPETVKTALALEQKWSQSRKSNVINAYTLFLKFRGMSWNKPKCPVTKKFPFIPSEQEIDALIAGSNKKLAAYQQLLKETGIRSGEAKRLEWTDIDKEKRIITLNAPEKGSNPRMWRVTETLIEMCSKLSPKKNSISSPDPSEP
jgi:integrase